MPTYCRSCVLPDTRPGVRLDADGLCGGCRNATRKSEIDWSAREAAFRRLVDDVTSRRTGPYDCVVPVSGGKDSYWQVVTCLEYGLRPLCVTYAAPGRNDVGERNLRRLVEVGVDHLEYRMNPGVERRFIEASFRRTGISGLVTHMAIYSVPIRMAIEQRIPLVVYGENSAFEYGSEWDGLAGSEVDGAWLRRFGVTDGTTARDWVGEGLEPHQLAPLEHPTDEALAAAGLRAVFMGHFFPWDPDHSYRVAAKHGFEKKEDGPIVGHYDFANIDDDLLGVHHHAKWYKFGITRTWDTLSMEIRSGRLSREEAIARLATTGDETPWTSIDAFCDYLGMSRREYFGILEGFRNHDIWSREDGRWRIDGFLLPDFDWPDDVRV